MWSIDQPVLLRGWLAAPVEEEVERSLLALARCRGVVRLAVMPDVHLAQEVCIGVALATDTTLYPGAVGGDMGCGMAAIGFHGEADLIATELEAGRLLLALTDQVPVNRHPRSDRGSRPTELAGTALGHERLERMNRREGRAQLGTLGRGNHFLELQRDEDNRLWLMVHSGSRAMGQAIRDHHLRYAIKGDRLPFFEAESPEGQAYLADHRWACCYAEANRTALVRRTCELLEGLFSVAADWSTFFQCQHNFIQREVHGGRRLWVHRKGALDAHQGVRGMIPGSMGSSSYHVRGRGHEPALCSSSHGAGRRMSRGEARRQVRVGGLEREMAGVYFDHRRARGLCEEAPSAYRDIDRVMRAQRELTKIERRLWPVLSYKGG